MYKIHTVNDQNKLYKFDFESHFISTIILLYSVLGGQPKLFIMCQHFFPNFVLFLLDEPAADDDDMKTLTDAVRMDHGVLQSINTSMRNAWFCSAPRGCIQQHSSASLPALSWFTGGLSCSLL